MTFWQSRSAVKTMSSLRISHYLHLKGAVKAVDYPEARAIVEFEEYYQSFLHSEIKFRQDYRALLDYSRQLNSILQAKKVTEADRGFPNQRHLDCTSK